MMRRALLLFALSAPAWAGEPINIHGALLPSDSQKVGENRYRTSDDWEGTNKTYDRIYPKAQFPRHIILNQPGIKAEHISIPGSRTVEGLNVYQVGDEIRIFIVQNDAKPKKKADAKSRK